MSEQVVRPLIFIMTLILFSTLERIIPFRRENSFINERRVNGLIIVFNSLFINVLFSTFLYFVILKVSQEKLGLLNLIKVDGILRSFLAVLFLDLAIYIQHVLTHKVNFLWRLHAVHHSDESMNTTTGFRFHPLEIVFSYLYKIVFVALIGVGITEMLIFEIILSTFAMFSHSNLLFPKSIEKIVSRVFVTPAFHRVHHRPEENLTQANYGFYLSIWDYIFGTYRADPNFDDNSFGISSDRRETDDNFLGLLKRPFLKNS